MHVSRSSGPHSDSTREARVQAAAPRDSAYSHCERARCECAAEVRFRTSDSASAFGPPGLTKPSWSVALCLTICRWLFA